MRTQVRMVRTWDNSCAWTLATKPAFGPARTVCDGSGRPVVWRDYAAMHNARTYIGEYGRRGLRRMGWTLSDDGRVNVWKAALLVAAAMVVAAALSGCANMCPGCWE